MDRMPVSQAGEVGSKPAGGTNAPEQACSGSESWDGLSPPLGVGGRNRKVGRLEQSRFLQGSGRRYALS